MDRVILSQEVERLRQQLGLRQSDVSQECGVNASMLSQWMQGRYKGKVERVRLSSYEKRVFNKPDEIKI